jgi:hypothetical protein
VGSGATGATGRFEVELSVPLASGEHGFTATATDRAGWVSPPSAPVSVRVVLVTPAEPAAGVRGRLALTALEDSPDPFDPVVDDPATLSARAEVRGVAGLAGASRNHRFDLELRWVLRDADTGAVRRTIRSATELPRRETVAAATISAPWNGTDDTGNLVAMPGLYPYDAELRVLRVWTGPGRGPACARDETPAVEGAGNAACVVDEIRLPSIGSIYVRHRPFRTGSGDTLRAAERLEAVHRASVRDRPPWVPPDAADFIDTRRAEAGATLAALGYS